MRLGRLVIDNIKGIEHAEVRFGALTIIRGANGTGKTSIKDALAMFFTGGCDGGWLRNGTQKGLSVLELVDESGEVAATMQKTVRRTKSGSIEATLEILDKNGVGVAAPQTYVNNLGESWAIDPGVLLSIDTSTATGRKALAAKLLEVMPIEFRAQEILETGCPPEAFSGSVLSLEAVNKARKYVYEMRRRVGVEKDDAEKTCKTLRDALPKDGEETDWAARARDIEQERRALEADERAEAKGINCDAQVERDASTKDFHDREIVLRQEFEEKLSALRAEQVKYMAAIDKAESEALVEISGKRRSEFDRLTAELATARERAGQQQKAQAIRESLSTFEGKRSEKSTVYEDLTATLEKLDDLKRTRLESLPVDGIDFQPGDVTLIDGVPWEHANRATRVIKVLQICTLAAGRCKFVAIDDCEHLDVETWELLKTGLAEGGFQVLAAKVDECPLTVETA